MRNSRTIGKKSLGLFSWIMCLSVCMLPLSGSADAAQDPTNADADYGVEEARKMAEVPQGWITADHSKFEALQKDFTSGPEVTEACLSCHNEAAKQVHDTIHWTWICPADPNKVMGKNGLTMNNF